MGSSNDSSRLMCAHCGRCVYVLQAEGALRQFMEVLQKSHAALTWTMNVWMKKVERMASRRLAAITILRYGSAPEVSACTQQARASWPV